MNVASDRGGIFAGDDPIALARAWLAEADRTEPNDPNAIALATVDADGLPDVRIVLLKEIEARGFVFYTNENSAKGRQIAATGRAAFVLHWKSLRRQVRVRGQVEQVQAAQSDAYFASRAGQSRVGAWASLQSEELASRADLVQRVRELEASLGPDPGRPPHWGGFRIVPVQIEFWADGEHRLHDRFRWSRPEADKAWDVARLYP